MRDPAASWLLPPPSPVFGLLLSCFLGSDKRNLDCGKGEPSLAGDSVCCWFYFTSQSVADHVLTFTKDKEIPFVEITDFLASQ